MAFLAGLHRGRSSFCAVLQAARSTDGYHLQSNRRAQAFCSGAGSHQPSDFLSAYELLEVSETSSFAEIKAAFRKLAKETHPDLAQSKNDPTASHRFVQILAAYEILSDTGKRAHYDRYLLSQRRILQKTLAYGPPYHWGRESHMTMTKQMEVVEWLKWYRFAIKEILSEKHLVAGSGYFDVLEGEFYSAIHTAYYGPDIESIDLLPDCFEAEERSVYGTAEVLHLVSGRDLFGMVCIANKIPEISYGCNRTLTSFESTSSTMCESAENVGIHINPDLMDPNEFPRKQEKETVYDTLDAYKDLELHVAGKVVALATRVPPQSHSDGINNEDTEDRIYVFLSSDESQTHVKEPHKDSYFSDSSGQRTPLGTITGLGTSPEEGSCFVYNNSGAKTHVIMKHRTLMVKHMHWYRIGDEASVCECRCSRARLPPSKFWLFEPRCAMHDIGGWYVETFGRDKKAQTVPSRRYWDGFDYEEAEMRLHPAVYLLTLAYRTLDLEAAKRKKLSVKDIADGLYSWSKKHI